MTKITGFSDTHLQHDKFSFEKTDILAFAGDCNATDYQRLIEFLDWFEQQPATFKIFVPGNHDWFPFHHENKTREECAKRDIKCLIHEPCEIDGIKFFGSPWTPEFCGWAFMKERDELADMWAQIPDNTEVLITHGPPNGILDYCFNGHVGCEALLERIAELDKKSLKYHMFGHIHTQAYKKKRVGNVTFCNVSVLDDYYSIIIGEEPIQVDLIK